MKPVVKNVVLFSAGALAGAIVMAVMQKDKMVQEYNKAVDDVTQKYEDMIAEQGKEIAKQKDTISAMNMAKKIIGKEDYSAVSDPNEGPIRPVYSSETKTETETKETESEEPMKEVNQDIPHLIDDETYLHDEEFDKRDLRYYEDGGNVCDDYDNLMDDSDLTAMLGDIRFDHFGEMSKSADTMCVRNPKTKVDYQITKFPGTYYDGLDHDDPKVKQMRMRNRND